jgi:hypothetical protein
MALLNAIGIKTLFEKSVFSPLSRMEKKGYVCIVIGLK